MALKIKEYVFQTDIEGKVVAEVKLTFQPKAPPTDREKMSLQRINAGLSLIAKKAERKLEEQISVEVERNG